MALYQVHLTFTNSTWLCGTHPFFRTMVLSLLCLGEDFWQLFPENYMKLKGWIEWGGPLCPLDPRRQWLLCFDRPKRSLGQGYVFTGVCDSVHRRGGGSSKFFWGGLFLGGFLQIFGGGVFFGGESSKFSEGVPPNFRGGGFSPRIRSTFRLARILLECILVSHFNLVMDSSGGDLHWRI